MRNGGTRAHTQKKRGLEKMSHFFCPVQLGGGRARGGGEKGKRKDGGGEGGGETEALLVAW